MALLKFNKSELVNLSYSLKREIILANKSGAYCNTSIITCNTRKYHGLLAVTLDRFGGDKYMMLSSLDESIVLGGKQFNLGIHCYGDIYEPRGHKYIVDFVADKIPQITYKIGDILIRKSIELAPDRDQVLIRYELLNAPSDAVLQLRPLLAFRNVHALTQENPVADTAASEAECGVSFCMYPGFPDLYLQMNSRSSRFNSAPCWYKGVTYSDEYRRGYDCREDLYNPGYFEIPIKNGESVVFSASMREEKPQMLKREFTSIEKRAHETVDGHDQLLYWADRLICTHNGKAKINAGLSWLYTGLLRESLMSLPGLTLYADGNKKVFEEVLDNIVADEQERLFRRTTQVGAPLLFAVNLQKYIDFGASPEYVWRKYGDVVCGIVKSYLPGVRAEVAMQADGLLWAQKDNTALSWMNTYVDGHPVTERAGYQVETNALWYNAVCFAVEMETLYGGHGDFVAEWSRVRDLIRKNYQPTFYNAQMRCLADYVDGAGQHLEVRPNQIVTLWVRYCPVDDAVAQEVLRVVDNELYTPRGLRSLSPRDVSYRGVYDGSQIDRDHAYYQGSAHPFLLEMYADVSFRIKGESFLHKAEGIVAGFYEDLARHGVGAFSELYDGDPPQEPHGAISSALSTSALLAIDYMVKKHKEG